MTPPATPPSAARRAADDRCPGALRLHAAADGPLARVRLPGGLLTGARAAALAALAAEAGDGGVELTSRGNVQLRGLTGADPAALAARLAAAGLLPSATHERVRNVLASPLSGRGPAGRLDVHPLVAALDAALCADPRLAGLPGRFLFALDDGTGDVAGAADAALAPAGGGLAVLVAGHDTGLRTPAAAGPGALAAVAHAFLDLRAADLRAADPGAAGAWRVTDLPGGPARVAARTAASLGSATAGSATSGSAALGSAASAPAAPGTAAAGSAAGVLPPWPAPPVRAPLGRIDQPDGRVALGLLVPLGRLDGAQLRLLADAATLVVTPWRSLVLPDLAPADAAGWARRLAAAGLDPDPASRWAGVTACAGRPGCAAALADVRADAAAAVTATGRCAGGDPLPVHWVGCERGCGSPAGAHVRVRATGSGYVADRRTGGPAPLPADPVARAVAVAAARRTDAGTAAHPAAGRTAYPAGRPAHPAGRPAHPGGRR